jgi:hypothetical protein
MVLAVKGLCVRGLSQSSRQSGRYLGLLILLYRSAVARGKRERVREILVGSSQERRKAVIESVVSLRL